MREKVNHPAASRADSWACRASWWRPPSPVSPFPHHCLFPAVSLACWRPSGPLGGQLNAGTRPRFVLCTGSCSIISGGPNTISSFASLPCCLETLQRCHGSGWPWVRDVGGRGLAPQPQSSCAWARVEGLCAKGQLYLDHGTY